MPEFESLDDLIAAVDAESGGSFTRARRNRAWRQGERVVRDEWAERAPSWPTMREARASVRWRPQTSTYRAQKVAADSLKVKQGEPEPAVERTLLEWLIRAAEQSGGMRTLRDMGSPKLAMKAGKASDPDAVTKLVARMIAEIDRRASENIAQPKPRKSK